MSTESQARLFRETFDEARILRFDSTGLTYVAADGHSRTIDFAKCSRTYAERMGVESIDRCRMVGIRDVLADPPYVAFCSDPDTVFEFRGDPPTPESPFGGCRADCHGFVSRLAGLGWITFDWG